MESRHHPLVAVLVILALIFLLPACGGETPVTTAQESAEPAQERWTASPTSPPSTPIASRTPTRLPTGTPTPAAPDWGNSVTWEASDPFADNGIRMDIGGDVDTEPISLGGGQLAQRTGNGEIMPADDGNDIEDCHLQFLIDDSFMSRGSPTSLVRIEVEYLDQGTDLFSIHYDASGTGGPFGDGRFMETVFVIKTDSGEFRTVEFLLRDAFFGNRDNGGDFRIGDNNDGAETIRRVTVTLILLSSDPDAPLLMDFYDDGDYLYPGDCTTLHWTVQNATEVTLNRRRVDPQGDRSVCPESTTTYVLKAQNSVDEKQEAITIVIIPRSSTQPSPAVVVPSPTAQSSPVYDFRAWCGQWAGTQGAGIMYKAYYEGWPMQRSGFVTMHEYSSVDAGHGFNLLDTTACGNIEDGSWCGFSFYTSDTCCQLILISNDDTNPANDTYSACW